MRTRTPDTALQYYITRNNQQLGPFTEAEAKAQLASGSLTPLDYVWWEGQANWIPLGESPLATAAAMPATPSAPPVPTAPVIPSAGALQPTSKLAVWALVCGCLGFFISLLASIPAIVLGHMSLNEIKKNPGMQGRGMALTGLILGYIFTLILPIISIVAISVLIALGNQVKATFKTINSQIAEANAAQATNSADQLPSPDQSTNAPDQSTNSPDQSTNTAPASTNAPDASTNGAPGKSGSPISRASTISPGR